MVVVLSIQDVYCFSFWIYIMLVLLKSYLSVKIFVVCFYFRTWIMHGFVLMGPETHNKTGHYLFHVLKNLFTVPVVFSFIRSCCTILLGIPIDVQRHFT